MRNLWLVARHEYRQMVLTRRFVLLTLAVPVGMLILVAVSVLVFSSGGNDQPIGYVDHSGRLGAGPYANLAGDEDRVEVRAYPDEEAAIAALKAGELQAVFVFPEGYPQSLNTDIYFLEEPPDGDAWGDLDDFVRASLVAPLPEAERRRLIDGSSVTVVDTESNRRFDESDILSFVLPFAGAFLLFFATMASSGQMLGVIAGEKENRTIEILVTSVSPGQLITGKTLGLLAGALTQLAIYALALVVGIMVAAPYVVELQGATVPWDFVFVVMLFFLPTFALLSAVMIAIGGAVTEVQQGQQVAGLLNLLFMFPVFVVPLMLGNPANPLLTFLTLFPTTSFLTIALRWGLGSIPLWQMGVAWVILVASAALMVWVAGRVFRVGMLRYGQPLTLKAAVAAVRKR